jgi:predicted transposase YbfD/YdcC
MHQLALYETGTGLVLKEQVVGDKENELSIVSQFLSPVWVKGRIISADALHTHHSFCREVTHAGGFFLLVAKGNQPTLRDDLQLFFSEPPVDYLDWRQARTVDKGHGRLEIRDIVVSTELNEFLAGKWTGVAQVFRLVRTVTKKGQTSEEVVYGLTALSPVQAGAQDLLAVVRAHWAIENRLHYRRDVTDAAKMPVKFARARLLASWPCSIVSCWLCSISWEFPMSPVRCEPLMRIPCWLFVS